MGHGVRDFRPDAKPLCSEILHMQDLKWTTAAVNLEGVQGWEEAGHEEGGGVIYHDKALAALMASHVRACVLEGRWAAICVFKTGGMPAGLGRIGT